VEYSCAIQSKLTPTERAAYNSRLNRWKALLEGGQWAEFADKTGVKSSDNHFTEHDSALN
jgi:hypothetical protein